MPKDRVSEEVLEEVLAVHDLAGGPDPEPDPDPESGPDQEMLAQETDEPGDPPGPSPDTDREAVLAPPQQKKKKRTYMTKNRLRQGADSFTDAIDWQTARIMRARGDTYAEIGAFFGCSTQTVTARFSREGWAKEIDAMHQAFQSRLEDSANASVQRLVEQGKTYREKLARASLVFADSVAKMNGAQLMAKAKDIGTLNNVARQTLGLDEGDKDQKTIVNIGFLSQIAEEQAVALPLAAGSRSTGALHPPSPLPTEDPLPPPPAPLLLCPATVPLPLSSSVGAADSVSVET